ncbi:MAG TPA: hypothetical protein VFL47_09705 [Flavisolibacter sp.]|nr:hypothetical protein [Flavisolibacter sp.]
MQQFQDRSSGRDQREVSTRVNYPMNHPPQQERRNSGEPAKFNTRHERRRIDWENDLYERQSI